MAERTALTTGVEAIRLLHAALLTTALIPTMATAADGLAICVRCPGTTLIASSSGHDKATARAVAEITQNDVDDCLEQGGQACAADSSDAGRRITASADCKAGRIKDTEGETFALAGRWHQKEYGSGLNGGMLKFRSKTGELVNASNAGDGQVLAFNYTMLCPMTFVRAAARESDRGSFETGRQIAGDRVDLATLDSMPYDHNGPIVIVDPAKGLIVYDRPKKSIRGTVQPGTVMFRGDPWDNDTQNVVVTGRARVFKKGCNAAEYDVRAMYSMDGGLQSFELEGASPVGSKTSCKITGHTINSPNAELKFAAAWD